MFSALPPLCPRVNRRSFESSIDSKSSQTTSTSLNKKRTNGEGLVHLSKMKSISAESARVKVVPFQPNSYLHRYDSRFVTIQKGVRSVDGEREQVQNEHKENNNVQIELAHISAVQGHTVQKQDLSVNDEFFPKPTAISTKNETNKENTLFESTIKKIKSSFEPNFDDDHVESKILLDTCQICHSPFPTSFRPNRAMQSWKNNKSKKREYRMVRNHRMTSTFPSWSISCHQQFVSAPSKDSPKPFFWSKSTFDPVLIDRSHRFEQVARIF